MLLLLLSNNKNINYNTGVWSISSGLKGEKFPNNRSNTFLGLSLHICVLSDWCRVKLEVEDQGHYLQPKRAASASSFSLGLLPASDLYGDVLRSVCYCFWYVCVYVREKESILMTLNGRRWKASSKTQLPVEHGGSVPMHTRVLTYHRDIVQHRRWSTAWWWRLLKAI